MYIQLSMIHYNLCGFNLYYKKTACPDVPGPQKNKMHDLK